MFSGLRFSVFQNGTFLASGVVSQIGTAISASVPFWDGLRTGIDYGFDGVRRVISYSENFPGGRAMRGKEEGGRFENDFV